MLRFVVRRLLLLVPIMVGLSLLVFLWIHALPGTPAVALLGERATPQNVAQFKRQYGLDKPIYDQYLAWTKTTLKGDFGYSIEDRRKVTTDFFERFPSTVELAVAAMLVSVLLGIPLGFIAAKRYGTWLDHSSLVASLIGISTPVFFLAIILKYLFAVKLHWLPTVGRISPLIDTPHPTNFYVLDAIIQRDWSALWDVIKHLILPALALGSIPLAIVARITRAAVLDVPLPAEVAPGVPLIGPSSDDEHPRATAAIIDRITPSVDRCPSVAKRILPFYPLQVEVSNDLARRVFPWTGRRCIIRSCSLSLASGSIRLRARPPSRG